MRNRIDIFREGTWYSLKLKENAAIKYNAVINKVGNVSSREISHSNTFSIPNITQNQKALGLNVFNARELARALNSKYIARYYVGDKLIKEGFIVINNSEDDIKLNFMDGALGIVDWWKATTFKELLQSPSITRPADYQTALDEMRNYDMTPGGVLPQLSNVGARGHRLGLFPNSLNQIGDPFQIGVAGVRQDDEFIVRQARPVYNAKAVFDLAVESYGYTPTYDPSVDWDDVASKFFSGGKANEGKPIEDVQQTLVHPQVAFTDKYAFMWRSTGPWGWNNDQSICKAIFKVPATVGEIPNYLNGATLIDFDGLIPARDNSTENLYILTQNDVAQHIYNDYSMFKPDLSGGNAGIITWEIADVDTDPAGPGSTSITAHVWGIWEHTNPNTYIAKEYVDTPVNHMPGDPITTTIDKSELNTPPAGAAANGFVGFIMQVRSYDTDFFGFYNSRLKLNNMQITETAVPQGEIVFNEYEEYTSDITDLTHAAPEKSIKDVLSGLMHQQGVLMNVNATDETVKFFSYGHYETQRANGNFYDWSDYFQTASKIKRHTDFGKNYGKVNRIGLAKPYQGNTYDRILDNHIEDSKYKSFAKDELKDFNDVISVTSIGNTTTPYFEFGVSDMALVQYEDDIGPLTQTNGAGLNQGVINDLAHVVNVNYYNLPYGVAEWYNLVNRALRVVGRFFLPVNVIKTLDITQPVFINDLGGFYIIEEIGEYVDSKTAVNVKLIRLIDNLKES